MRRSYGIGSLREALLQGPDEGTLAQGAYSASMAQNLIEQVKEIEAEADRILAEAQAKAGEIEGSVKQEVAALRKNHEDALAEQAKAFAQEVERRTVEELRELDKKAKDVAGRLASPSQEAASGAAELILQHLRED